MSLGSLGSSRVNLLNLLLEYRDQIWECEQIKELKRQP